jgi:hypothetical protein
MALGPALLLFVFPSLVPLSPSTLHTPLHSIHSLIIAAVCTTAAASLSDDTHASKSLQALHRTGGRVTPERAAAHR